MARRKYTNIYVGEKERGMQRVFWPHVLLFMRLQKTHSGPFIFILQKKKPAASKSITAAFSDQPDGTSGRPAAQD